MNPERYLSNFRGSYHLHSLILIIQYHQTRASFVRLSDIRAVADVCNKVVPNLIYEIRGKRVMLDSDLARLYGVETRALKQAVRRNIGRFPSDFMFE